MYRQSLRRLRTEKADDYAVAAAVALPVFFIKGNTLRALYDNNGKEA
jgi:hypothetical protein